MMDWTDGAKKRLGVNRLGDPRKRRNLYVTSIPGGRVYTLRIYWRRTQTR